MDTGGSGRLAGLSGGGGGEDEGESEGTEECGEGGGDGSDEEAIAEDLEKNSAMEKGIVPFKSAPGATEPANELGAFG